MNIEINSTSSNAQNIDWQSVFNHAHEHSLEFEAGDSLPLGRVSVSLQAVTSGVNNGTASWIIQRAVRNEKLREQDGEYKIVRDGPGTGDIRQSLDKKLRDVMRNGETAVIQSPTSSGKTYAPSTERWRDYPEITGGQPVILLSGTTDARDDAIAKSRDSWASAEALYGRNDVCSVARGDYDSNNRAGNDAISAPDGTEPSEWFKKMCDDRSLTLSFAHGEFKRLHDGDLPCCAGKGPCPSEYQWADTPRGDDGDVTYDVLHATHPFAQVPQLIENCNVIIDERPDFSVDLPGGKMRESVTSYLDEIDADVPRWEDLLVLLRQESLPEGFREDLSKPDIEWFRTNSKAHTLAPGIVQAIANAEERAHDRWVGETRYRYPELIPGRDGPTQEMTIRVVIDENNRIPLLQAIPDFSNARSVIGLDAHPTMPKWRGNTVLSIALEQIVDDIERHKWRRNQRKLKIVQVGDNKNTWTKQGFNSDKVGVLTEELRWKYGDEFRTGITANQCHDDLRKLLKTAGVEDPETLYYGNEKSVGCFGSEGVGLVAGCISPSSDHIKNWLALLDKDAVPKREVRDDYQGQEWVGSDRTVAEELLADVRENGVKQACGRYARSPQDSDSGATVYVLTDVLPDAYVDETTPDVRVFGNKQKRILDYACGHQQVRPHEIADEIGVSKRHAHDTLMSCRTYPWMEIEEDVGSYNAFEFDASRSPNGLVDV